MHVLFPGSFDPPTNGHLRLVERAAGLFDEVTVLVGVNPQKSGWLEQKQRVKLMEEICSKWKHVHIKAGKGLLVEDVRRFKADAILKGLRNGSDFENERMMAEANFYIGKSVETVFLIAGNAEIGVSSSLVRQIFTLGGDISSFVPAVVLTELEKTL